MKTEILINEEYTDGNFTGVCSDISRGWVTLTDEEGVTKKFRAKQLKPAGEQKVETMSKKLAAYRKNYVKVGNTYHNGDDVAQAMHGRELHEVYQIGGKLLDMTAGELEDKYQHLNPGAQRMNVGNRIRNQFKQGNQAVCDWVEDQINLLRKAGA